MTEKTDNRVRGYVNHLDMMVQPLIFDDMLYIRNSTLTDIDTFIELNGVLFIYGEIKWAGLELTTGQKLALERVVKSHTRGGSVAAAYIANHAILPPEPVHIKNLPVSLYYFREGWKVPNKPTTIDEFHNQIMNWCTRHKITI